MAQTIDLPEPTQAPAANASADDLLSQLAGEEIDKLLAEAEIEKPSAVAAAPETTAPEATAVESQTLTEIAAAAPEPVVPSLPAEPAPSAQPEAAPSKQGHAEAAVSAELDELFKELSSDATIASPPPAAPAPVAPKPSAPPAAAPVATAPAQPKAPDQPTSNQERAALDAIEETEHDASDQPDAPASLPIYLKPLEWLNLPLSFVPEPARDLVGKVAIISFVNALSVIVYLLVFHRR
jgi:hypothetical protein